MQHRFSSGRTKALKAEARKLFETQTFSAFKMPIGIVCTNYDFERPMVFKYSVQQSHGRASTFKPGFGCTIADAVVASCAAYPFFSNDDGQHRESRRSVADGWRLCSEQSDTVCARWRRIQGQPTRGVRPNAKENTQLCPLNHRLNRPRYRQPSAPRGLDCRKVQKVRISTPDRMSSGESRTHTFEAERFPELFEERCAASGRGMVGGLNAV